MVSPRSRHVSALQLSAISGAPGHEAAPAKHLRVRTIVSRHAALCWSLCRPETSPWLSMQTFKVLQEPALPAVHMPSSRVLVRGKRGKARYGEP